MVQGENCESVKGCQAELMLDKKVQTNWPCMDCTDMSAEWKST